MKKTLLLVFIASAFVAKSQINMGLVAHYPFNGNANDSGSNGLNASINKAIPATDRYGRANHAYKFGGDSNTYISVPHNSLLNLSGDKTISLWYKIDTLPNEPFACLILKEGTNFVYTTFTIQFNDDAGYSVNDRHRTGFFFGSGSTNYLLSTKEKYTDTARMNKWVHIVATYSQTTGYSKIYYNGVVSDSLYIGSKTANVSTMPMQIGRGTSFSNFDNNYFKGYLDEIRLYNRALNDNEVDSIFSKNDTVANNPPLSIEPSDIFKNVMLYPNPTRNDVTIGGLFAQATVEMYDMTGKLVATNYIDPANNSVKTEHLKEGIYTVRISDNQYASYYKLVIK